MSGVDAFVPAWPTPPGIRAWVTERGTDAAPASFDGNLAAHVGDVPADVEARRAALARATGVTPVWLEQVHGTAVVDLDRDRPPHARVPRADAAVTTRPGLACAILTADCLPVLFTAADGSVVGAAHAGWRGLCAGVLEATVAAMRVARARAVAPAAPVPPLAIRAWLGPAIGPDVYEVGEDVRAAFRAVSTAAEAAHVEAAFRPLPQRGKYLCDLPALARIRLARVGVVDVAGGDCCTVSDARRFFSYRRDGRTGRMASLIWIDAGAAPIGENAYKSKK